MPKLPLQGGMKHVSVSWTPCFAADFHTIDPRTVVILQEFLLDLSFGWTYF
jgi:hypothetical protein